MWFEPLAHLRSPLAGYCRRCLEVAITPSSSLEAFYYRVAAMQSRYCDKHLSVRLSVRPSVKRVHCDKTKAPSEKKFNMTNRKSPTSLPMSLR